MSVVPTSSAAKRTLAVIEAGRYQAPSGAWRELRELVDRAVSGTRLYRPEDGDALLAKPARASAHRTRIDVTSETTSAAARRLSQDEGVAAVTALNFASAKNPGGGFLGGAKAQEEDLARCSALFPCLITKREYYDENRASGTMIYLDHVIHSPGVPFFLDDRLAPLEQPFACSMITAPAPNAGEALRRDAGAGPEISRALRRRAGKVLAIAEAEGARCLILGAWGCGVFRNDPTEVAAVFADWLGDRFRGTFERVVFAIYDRSRTGATLAAFEKHFGA